LGFADEQGILSVGVGLAVQFLAASTHVVP
jgi:hypothetical protein